MRVAALIVSYHTGPVLERCLDAVSAQCDQIVLADNGNSPEVSGRLRADDRLHYLAPPGNVGFGWACNLAARAAEADAYLILNPDAVLAPGCVERLVAALESGATVAGARLVDSRGRELKGSRRRRLSPLNILRGHNLHRQSLPSKPQKVGAVSGACFLIRAAEWTRLRGFDPRYFLHVEDLDLCHRVHDSGGSVVFVPDAEVEHEGATSAAPNWVVETHKAMGLKAYLIHYYPIVGRLLWPAMSLALRSRRRRSGAG